MKTLKLFGALFIALFLTTSLTELSAQVKSDFDKDTDFTQFKTYSFAGWQKNSDEKLNEFDKKRVLESLKSEFGQRGMTYQESDADVKVALYVVLDKKTSTTAYTDFMGGNGFGPRWGWGMGAGNVSATTTYSNSDYTEGTLVVDMYTPADNALVWQGILTSTVTEKPEKRDKTIPKNIKKLMKKYPVPVQK
ncbi:hypothetical protein GCM10007049_00440 [Echinicola pacifica]|uniref:DUF4136 domain-containing protein n=1 Tax=Echinicola pacifica TaxID=346377 RepID=A0A918UIN6_9BACT|nr:DUF4136 domain-containing protein [Echinicola pacifica]GGZ12671.1 hypothetical protein GCM10007049_00440 [Echinicola pacifica]